MIRRLWSRLISAIAPTWPGDYSRLDLMDGLGSLDGAPAITEEIPIVTTHDPRWSQAGLASLRRFPTSGGDTDGGGRYRCASCDTFVPLGHVCPQPTPAAALAAALPVHGLVLTDDQTEAEMDLMAEVDAYDGVAPLIAHSQTIRIRRLTLIRSAA